MLAGEAYTSASPGKTPMGLLTIPLPGSYALFDAACRLKGPRQNVHRP